MTLLALAIGELLPGMIDPASSPTVVMFLGLAFLLVAAILSRLNRREVHE